MLRTIFILFGIMLTTSVLAGTMREMGPGNQYLIGISAGPTWITGNKTQTLNLQPDIEKTYTATNNSFYFPSAELFLGLQKPLYSLGQSLLGQLGFSVVGAGNAKLTGDIGEDADPDFDNFTYAYKVNHAHVAIKGRLIGNCGRLFEPYISGSAGVGFNHAYHFIIKPKVSDEVAAPPFKSNTTTTFVYTLGVGLQKSFSTHLKAAIGYEFADWGKTSLARAPGQTVNQGLTLNHLYANQFQLSLFYIV